MVPDKHKKWLRRFVAPYHNLKFHPHPVVREILKILNTEQEFICKFLDWVESSEANSNYDPRFQAKVQIASILRSRELRYMYFLKF